MIPEHDFDQLSAYVDDQLVPAEKAALEARLAGEPELRSTLRELRLTVRALRALPPVALPRSLVLTPAQVAQSRPKAALPARQPLAPALRLAATFSAVALAFVVFTDLRGGVVLTAAPVADVASNAAATTSAAEAPLEAVPAPSETLVAADETMIMDMAVEAATPSPAAEGDAALTGPAATDAGATPESSAALLPEPSATPSADRNAATAAPEDTTSTKSAAAAPTETPISVAAVAPPEATGAVDDAYDQTPTEIGQADTAGGAQPTPAPGLSTLRVVELALVILTVLLGLGAWLARRSG